MQDHICRDLFAPLCCVIGLCPIPLVTSTTSLFRLHSDRAVSKTCHCEDALYAANSNLRLHGSRTPQCAQHALLRHIQAISLMRPHGVLYHVPDRFYAAMVQTAQALLSIVLCHNFQPFPEHLLRPTTGGASVAGPDKDQSALVKWVKEKIFAVYPRGNWAPFSSNQDLRELPSQPTTVPSPPCR